MSSDEQLQQAIMAAHDAGDTLAARALAAEILRRRGVKSPKDIYNATQQIVDPHILAARNFAQEMPLGSQMAAGAGKAVSDVGLGVRQIVGNAPQSEVDAVKKQDAPLMDTTGGMVGNIAGNVGMASLPGLGLAGAGANLGMKSVQAAGRYALASPSSLGGAAVQGGMGAAQGALQPVATGESRASNAVLGGVGGAAVPSMGMALKAGKAVVEPLYEGGRQQILARALRGASGDNADTIIQNMKSSRELVPGSQPTAAEVANSGGIAAMQRAASAVDPEAYTTRAVQQNEARVGALRSLEGAPGARTAADTARESKAGPLYRQARESGIDPEMAEVLKPQMKNLTERMPSGVMEKARELARLNGETMGKEGSVSGLHWMKIAVDDMLSSGKQTGIGEQTTRALTQFKNDLVTVMDDLSPTYKQARETYASMSRPINQMDIGSELSDKSINKLTGQIQPQSYARALSDDTAARATGFNKATLSNTLEPQQLSSLNAIKDDLARSVQARDLGRGPGSDTVQKLSMTNLLQQSGLPMGVLDVPGLGRLGNWAYSNADDKMKAALAKALLNPREAASIMEKGVPRENAKALSLALRASLTPAITGSAIGLQDAR